MKRFRHGLVAGRFAPLHAGHQHLVAEAVRQCDRVTVQLLSERDEVIPVDVRAAWLRELHPDVSLAVVDVPVLDPITVASAAEWRRWFGRVMSDQLPAPVDAVFTADRSDAYDDDFLELQGGATQVFVDPGRRQVPVAARAVREHPERFWSLLAPPVRAWYVQRVVVVDDTRAGLGAAVARALRCAWVPAPDEPGSPDHPGPRHRDVAAALRRQQQEEHTAARGAATPWLVTEVDATVARVRERLLTGQAPAEVPSQSAREPWESAAAQRRPQTRLYVLGPVSADVHAALAAELTRRGAAWVDVAHVLDAHGPAAATRRVLERLPELDLPSASGVPRDRT